MTPSMRLLQETAVEEGILERYHQVAPALNGARLAYNLDSCEGFELEPDEECDINGCNFIMIVSYERNRLSLSMVDVGLYVCQPYNIANYSQYGEANGSIVSHSPIWSSICLSKVPHKLIMPPSSLTSIDTMH